MASEAPNAAQVAYWNESAGPTWADLQEPLDRQLGPLTLRTIDALRPRPGERVLDVGCGAGASSLELADAVGMSGEVVGVDISRTLLDVAKRRADNLVGIRFLEGDAQTYPFEPASFDAAFSRFGVMFFADPVAAFANIRRALEPGGRLAFVCWRSPAENPILSLPLAAALQHLPPQPPHDPDAPGPFAFADPDKVRRILDAGGFTGIAVTPNDMKMGSADLETALELAQRVGPLGRLLRESPDRREAAVTAVRAALAAHEGPDGVLLDSATWIVTARAPG
jgi:SAM-dependent methyltransferase